MNLRLHIVSALLLLAFGQVKAFDFNALSLVGVHWDYSVRQGEYLLTRNHGQALDMNSLHHGGVIIGKRWHIASFVRMQASAVLNFSSVLEDTLPEINLSDGSRVATTLTSNFVQGGMVVEFHYLVGRHRNSTVFYHAGGGVHGVKKRESESTVETTPRLVGNDPYLETKTMFSASVHGGIGAEFALSKRSAVTLSYSLRYWYPVHYVTKRDLFPSTGVDYRERFIAHEIDVQLGFRSFGSWLM